MDYGGLPVSKRTRQQRDLKLLELYNEAKKRKEKNQGVKDAQDREEMDIVLLEDEVEEIKRRKLCNVPSKSLRQGRCSQSDSMADGSLEAGSTHSVLDPLGSEGLMSVQNSDDVVIIDGSSDDDADEVFMAEGVCSDSVQSNCSTSMTMLSAGMGSKASLRMGTSDFPIEGDGALNSSSKGMLEREPDAVNTDNVIDLLSVDSDSNSDPPTCGVEEGEEEEEEEEEKTDDDDDLFDEDFQITKSNESDSSSSSSSEDLTSSDSEMECKNNVVNGSEVVEGDGSVETVDQREDRVEKSGSVNGATGLSVKQRVPNNSTYSVVQSNSVASRTRSHFNPINKKMKFGSFSRPLCVDEENKAVLSEDLLIPDHAFNASQMIKSCGSDCCTSSCSEGSSSSASEAECKNIDKMQCSVDHIKVAKVGGNTETVDQKDTKVEKSGSVNRERTKEAIEAPGRCKRRFPSKSTDGIIQNTGVASRSRSIFNPVKKKVKFGRFTLPFFSDEEGNEEVELDDLVRSSDGVLDEAKIPRSLPLKFTFGIPESKPPEKSEFDKELDQLWKEFDFTLRSLELGPTCSSMVYNTCDDGDDASCRGKDRATLCSQGKHQFILDDQIGIKCKFCSVVSLEVKHILPSLIRHPCGKSGKNGFADEGHSLFDELPFHGDDTKGSDPLDPAEGTVWDMVPGVRASMYPHQREGFEFIWKNVAGGIHLDKLKDPTGGSGCIISHAPGTGKTRLTIVFLQAYMKLFPTCRPIIIAPCSMLLTWGAEFVKWKVGIPFHDLNKPDLSGNEDMTAVNALRRVGNGCVSSSSVRMLKLYSWKKKSSILGISYRLFEQLAGGSLDTEKRRKSKWEVEAEQVRKILVKLPGVVVLDEGHTPRNDQSLIWKAVSKIKTGRRIILSGTPFQNNFRELCNTLCLVRPLFVHLFPSLMKTDANRKKRGRKCSSERRRWAGCLTDFIADNLTPGDGKWAGSSTLKELKNLIDPFVHIHKGNILLDSLPGLRDTVVVLNPFHLQKRLLEAIDRGVKKNFELEYMVSLVSVHPSLLPQVCLAGQEESMISEVKLEEMQPHPEAGVKTKFLLEFIRLSEALNEKVLVFSQFINPLAFIKDQLKSCYGWSEGREVLYMDGHLDAKVRQGLMNMFNEDGSPARVLLASTKACSEGISLVGASRVVLLDVVWNPSVERQAISRAYRLGQKKVVYIYHLITAGTTEAGKYCRQSEKERMSELVFARGGGGQPQDCSSSTRVVAEDRILEEMICHEQLKHMFEKIINQPKESNLVETFGLLDGV